MEDNNDDDNAENLFETVLSLVRGNATEQLDLGGMNGIELLPNVLEHIDEFVNAISGNTSIHAVILAAINHSSMDDGYVKLCRALGHLENLLQMHLFCFSVSSNDATPDYRKMMTVLENVCQVTKLCLWFNGELDQAFMRQCSSNEADRFRLALQGLSSLQEFELHNVAHSDDLSIALDGISTLKNLNVVRLYGVDSVGLRIIKKKTDLLEHVGEMYLFNLELNNSCCQAMSTALASDSTSLVKLGFYDCQLAHQGREIFDGLCHNSSLCFLQLSSSTPWDDAFYNNLSNVVQVNKSLNELRVSGGTNAPYEPVFGALTTNDTLKTLQLVTGELNESLCRGLSSSLESNSSLLVLSLDAYISEQAWLELLNFLKVNTTLKRFLYYGTIGSSTLLAMGSVLAVNTGLKHMRVQLDPEAHDMIAQFLDQLKTNVSLKKLDFGHVRVRDEHAVICAARRNFGLESIEIYPKSMLLQRMLNVIGLLNKAGRCYLAEDEASRATGVEVLIQVIDDLDCLYFHLRENPDLCHFE